MNDNISVNDTVNNNLDELTTATDKSYDIDEKEDEVTVVNNEINNTNKEESDIPLYQWA